MNTTVSEAGTVWDTPAASLGAGSSANSNAGGDEGADDHGIEQIDVIQGCGPGLDPAIYGTLAATLQQLQASQNNS